MTVDGHHKFGADRNAFVWVGPMDIQAELPKAGWICETCISEHERDGNLEHFGWGPNYEMRKPCSVAAYMRLFEVGASRVINFYFEKKGF